MNEGAYNEGRADEDHGHIESYVRNAQKIFEIGFGLSETTSEIADAYRDNDYFGIEVHVPGVGALCKQITERGLVNLCICQHDAVEVVRDMLPETSLDGVHLFFELSVDGSCSKTGESV